MVTWLRLARALSVVLCVVGPSFVGCTSTPDDDPGTGGRGGGMSSGTGGAVSGGGGSVTPGTGGTTAGTGGVGTGSGGTTVGGTGGRGGAATGTGGGSTGGRGGSGGTATGTGGAGGAGDGDGYVSGVTITVLDVAKTILVVNWMQVKPADETRLEFTFQGASVMSSRAKPGTMGAHRDVVLGVPASTNITVRIVSKQGGGDHKTRDYQQMTGALPSTVPKPTVSMHDPALSSPERYMLGAAENSQGGCSSASCYYNQLFYIYIMDRQGRIVWYYAEAANNPTSSFPRIARDGEYIWIEKRPFGHDGSGVRGVLKMTLDRQYMQYVSAPISDCIDVGPDGTLLYDAGEDWLSEMNRQGTVRQIWSCRKHFGMNFRCYTNTINWDPTSDSVVMSYPYQQTVIQVDRKTGTVLGQYGAAPGSYAFQPAGWVFGFQHFANITPAGTLLLSAHLPDALDTFKPKANKHAFQEWEIDRTNKRLVQKWIYTEGPEWAAMRGMAIRLKNGNTLANYGTGGVIREITPDKKTVYYVKFDVPTGDDFFNKMLGHNEYIDDLYKLNGGGPTP